MNGLRAHVEETPTELLGPSQLGTRKDGLTRPQTNPHHALQLLSLQNCHK